MRLSKHYLIYVFILLNVILSAWWLLHGDVRFDVDIARDLFLVKEIVTDKPITLIGSHTSISGVFHGPAWYYLNVPAYILGKGDPVFIGWFWWGFSIFNLLIFFFITKKLFNKTTSLLATLLYSANAIINPIYGLKMFFPPYGAVVLFPVFFYFFIRYIEKKKLKYLGISLFILGLMIQFEMAFGIPILILTLPFLTYLLFKNRLIKHFLILPIILIPLSTFLLFDLRHNFIQTTSLLGYLASHIEKSDFNLIYLIESKITGIFSETFFHLTQDNIFLSWFYSLLFVFLIFKVKMEVSIKRIYFVFIYFYFGYWLLHLSLKPLWPSYYWPFLPMIIMLYAGFINYLPKKIFLLIFMPLLFWNIYIGINYIKNYSLDITHRGKNSWAFHKLVAEEIFKDANGDFGYFIFTPDRWVYQSWYAMDVVQRTYPQKYAHPFSKQKLVYLIIIDYPKQQPEPISMGWRITDLKITSEPVARKIIGEAEIQKFYLTEEEKNKPVNPYLLNSIFFR